jgi:hypothetical protein
MKTCLGLMQMTSGKCRDIDSIRGLGDAAGTSMLLGILSFMASIVCLAVATQPVVVWACTIMACSCVFFLPLVNRGLAYFGSRKQVSLYCFCSVLFFHQDCQAFSTYSCRDRLPDEMVPDPFDVSSGK